MLQGGYTIVLIVIQLLASSFSVVAFLTPTNIPSSLLAPPTVSLQARHQQLGLVAKMAASDPEVVLKKKFSDQHQASLISSFLVDISKASSETILEETWSLTPIEDIALDDDVLSSGAKSWKALHRDSSDEGRIAHAVILKSQVLEEDKTIQISVLKNDSPSGGGDDQDNNNRELLSVLSKVMAQSTASRSGKNASHGWNVNISTGREGDNNEIFSNIQFTIDSIPQFFGTDASIETVDMVDSTGTVLGMIPRTLVHSWNILHRGIGLTVSKKDANFSELYVHRRTDFKRIFPSLYDMFVGGVSGSGEDARLTAAREVAEELGLSRALLDDEASRNSNNNQAALSDPLFTCVVCTSYNRCVVTVFQYTMDPTVETVSWQEEEVSWGEFVPYTIVEASADLSIQRLASSKQWPGNYPFIQSKWKGSQPPNEDNFETEGSSDWKTWDYVPDGLLVWEAWLQWRSDNQ